MKPGWFVGFWSGKGVGAHPEGIPALTRGGLGAGLGKGETMETFVAAGTVVASHADPEVLVFQPALTVFFAMSRFSRLQSL